MSILLFKPAFTPFLLIKFHNSPPRFIGDFYTTVYKMLNEVREEMQGIPIMRRLGYWLCVNSSVSHITASPESGYLRSTARKLPNFGLLLKKGLGFRERSNFNRFVLFLDKAEGPIIFYLAGWAVWCGARAGLFLQDSQELSEAETTACWSHKLHMLYLTIPTFILSTISIDMHVCLFHGTESPRGFRACKLRIAATYNLERSHGIQPSQDTL